MQEWRAGMTINSSSRPLAGGMFGLLRGAAVLTLRLVVTAGLVAASAGVTAVALSAANGGSIGATVHTSRQVSLG